MDTDRGGACDCSPQLTRVREHNRRLKTDSNSLSPLVGESKKINLQIGFNIWEGLGWTEKITGRDII